jgi:amino acid adenylation domain-containing protein/non-ribosomal peptide synthase protein (TIGR01720 family)
MADIVATIRALPPERRAKLAERLPRLSYAQEQLWLHQQLDPAGATYNVQYVLRASGPLDPARLRAAALKVAERHAILRTSFIEIEGTPRQVISDAAVVDWAVEDVSALPDGEGAALARIAALLRVPFDLERLPLLRLHVFRIAEEQHILALIGHHVLLDASAVSLFAGELAAIYGGHDADLPALPLQYADYAVWQRSAAGEREIEGDLAYWRERLLGLPDALDLPTDRPRGASGTGGSGRATRSLAPDLRANIDRLCKAEGATRFMVMLASWAALLARYSGSTDLCIGAPVSGRTRAELAPLIGNFVNSVAMRLTVEGRATFSDMLKQARNVVTTAFAHQNAPLQRVLDKVRGAGDPQRSRLFGALINMVAVGSNREASSVAGLRLEPVTTIDPAGAMFDLGLVVHDLPDGITLHLDYDAALFDAATAERMLTHLELLLEALLACPQAPMASLTMLSSDERETLLGYGRGERIAVPAPCVHELVEAQARRTPDAVAVTDGDRVLTYSQLDRRANALARRLRDLGVRPECFVFTLLAETIDVVIAWLAVLKAGGAFIPLDIGAPVHRNQTLLDGYPAYPLLSDSAFTSGLELAPGRFVPVVGLSDESDAGEAVAVRPDNPIYAMFTSGSTGVPKGVVVTHGGIMNRLAWMTHHFPNDCAARVLKTTRHTFDSSIWQIFWPLSLGGRTVMIDAAMPDGVRAAFQLIKDAQVTAVDFVPSAFSAMREELDACAPAFDWLPSLRLAIFGGEQVTRDGVDWFHHHSDALVYNLYGPTEASIGCIHRRLERDYGGFIPIGRPIANTDVLLLSADLQPVPVNVPGEICLVGACLARGYLNQPTTTAAAFLPSPAQGGDRLYRTGDLGRWLPDGSLEFLGRIDHQVKIRGFRVELGEIESVLVAHPSLARAVVLAHQEAGPTRLTAYVVAKTGLVADPAELRDHLRTRLPDHMVPSHFIVLSELPMLPNGKLDRRSLPSPLVSDAAELEEDDLPRPGAEQAIARIICEVIGLERIGRHDNYFEIGGDSIQSIRIAARARQSGIQLSGAQIFAQQTIARMAEAADRASGDAGLPDEDLRGRYPLTPVQRRFVLGGGPLDTFCHTVVLTCRSRVEAGIVTEALRALEMHHDVLRLRLMPDEAGWMQVYHVPDPDLACEDIDLSGIDGPVRETVLRDHVERLRAGLDVTGGPMLRAALFDLGAGGQRLCLVLHHLVTDAVSWSILMEDLQRALVALAAGNALRFPAKTTSYGRWAVEMERQAGSVLSRAAAEWWAQQPWSRATSLPLLPPEAAGASGHHAASILVSPERTRMLVEQSWSELGMQVGDVALACVVGGLAAVAGSPWQAIAVEGHGRDAVPELSVDRTVGWFTAVYPLLLEANRREDLLDDVRHVGRQVRQVPGRGAAFGIERYLTNDPALAAISEPQLLFNYVGHVDGAIGANGMFELAPENGGWRSDERRRSRHLVEVNASIMGGGLRLHWTWNAARLDPATIAALTAEVERRLTAVADRLGGADVQLGPPDFDLLVVE